MKTRTLLTAAALALLATPALAHPGHLSGAGFADGAAHPLNGIDHLLAMVTVGLCAALIGGRALWTVPAAFVGAMLAGGALGMAGIGLPLVEPMIYASVVVLALLCVLPLGRSATVTAALAAWFGLFHGHAHGAEMPEGAAALGYALGFVLATAALHGAGLAAGLGLRRLFPRALGRPAASDGR
ncbi:HupE/UreJ family protein [Azospirillum sp. ST 5-10]|uniref:HupE/UreJ family protein n=1 Tax=unclassified Azospirillum TaxID=2630922 RepID=UPI003F4A0648